MKTIFDRTFSTPRNMGNIVLTVDPFTGRTNTYLPPVVRYPDGPLLAMRDFIASSQTQMLHGEMPVQMDADLATIKDVYNPGLAHYQNGYVMLVRYGNSFRGQEMYLATSDDGICWKHIPRPLRWPIPPKPRADSLKAANPELPAKQTWRKPMYYDPRITQMGDEYLVTLAVDYDTTPLANGDYYNICDNILYRTRDFKKVTLVGAMAGNTRNAILFPRKINGYYYNACRPNTFVRSGEATTGKSSVLFRSRDLLNWEPVHELFCCGHAWMIYGGPGFPPFETEKYWVMGAHGVETHGAHRVHYRAGICLLDKKTMKRASPVVPILDPEEPYELTGLVDNVVFPTGVLFSDGTGDGVKSRDTKVAIYYGGADHVIHAGLSTVGRLIDYALGNYNPYRQEA